MFTKREHIVLYKSVNCSCKCAKIAFAFHVHNRVLENNSIEIDYLGFYKGGYGNCRSLVTVGDCRSTIYSLEPLGL